MHIKINMLMVPKVLPRSRKTLFVFILLTIATISGYAFVRSYHIKDVASRDDNLPANTYNIRRTEKRLLTEFAYDDSSVIERNIWQLWPVSNISDLEFPESCRQLVRRWEEANPEYKYHLISIDTAMKMIKDEFGGKVPEVVEIARSMPDERLRYEYLKYVLTFLQGGVYADIDTLDVKPISHWTIPSENNTRLTIGIVSDYNHDNWEDFFNRRMIFSNSLFVAKKHHPFLAKLIAHICYVASTQKQLIQNTNWTAVLTDYDVNGDPTIQFTGPSIFSDTFFDYLNGVEDLEVKAIDKFDKEQLSSMDIKGPDISGQDIVSYRNFTGLSRPVKLNHGIVILPQVGFNGFENYHDDEYDDNDVSVGYDSFFYARPLSLTGWSHRKLRFDSS